MAADAVGVDPGHAAAGAETVRVVVDDGKQLHQSKQFAVVQSLGAFG